MAASGVKFDNQVAPEWIKNPIVMRQATAESTRRSAGIIGKEFIRPARYAKAISAARRGERAT